MARGFPVFPGGVQVRHFEIAASDNVLDPRPTMLWVEGEGTFTMEDEAGIEVVYSVNGGIFFYFSPVKITSIDTITDATAPVRVVGWGVAQA